MTHIAIQEHLNEKTVEWMEKVSDTQYGTPVDARGSGSRGPARSVADGSAQPTPAQRLIGDFAPSWSSSPTTCSLAMSGRVRTFPPQDRRLVTVSALIAMNRPERLRSHLARARENGVTHDELIEAITHLAFHAGWPNAITAISVAKEVLQRK
jgi:4-carboxymuconolactone decarboxylase